MKYRDEPDGFQPVRTCCVFTRLGARAKLGAWLLLRAWVGFGVTMTAQDPLCPSDGHSIV
jgi:hypothetical protein